MKNLPASLNFPIYHIKKYKKTCKLILLLILNFSTINVHSQATFTQNNTAAELATELSNNGGFTITNPVITNGNGTQLGVFANGPDSGLTLTNGIVLTTGTVNNSFSLTSDVNSSQSPQTTTYNDPDLVAINPASNNDTVVYEFDFSISGAVPKIFALDYQFASEEYPDYVCSEFNDIFGFFISGGDLAGTSNLASIQGDNVAINNINSGTSGANGNPATNPCQLDNSSFYIDNGVGTHLMVYNGFTTQLRAYTILRPGIIYHMKMTIADTADSSYDSAVFLDNIHVFPIPPSSDIDFDGVDDYLDTNSFVSGYDASTMMGWFKLDNGFSSIGNICGQENFKLFVDSNRRIKTTAITTGGVTLTIPDANAPIADKDLWYHVTSKFNGSSGTLTLFVNGEQVWEGAGLGNNLDTSYTDNFEIGRNNIGSTNHFKGAIDEVKVYNIALNSIQIQEQVYQEIENLNGFIAGSVIKKVIDNGSLPWSNLVLYYNMNLIYDLTIIDNSLSVYNGLLHNITTILPQTAPLPYVANASGSWTTTGTWEYGTVWDITSLPNKDWAIVQVTNNAKVTTTASHTHLGLLVDSGSELEIQNDQLLNNTSYVKLDGQIDLVGESQLIQTINSDLDQTSSGYLERDQQGQSSIYNYNYWSSPVSPVNISANNTDYSVADILKDGSTATTPQDIIFATSGYNGSVGTSVTLADYWMYKYVNQPDLYGNWANGHVRSTGTIKVGQGYTQKGSGATTVTQNYVFTGKPNNGMIQHTIGANNVYLIGNPYASALDADQFINDNLVSVENTGDVIGTGASTGALYFWEHFSTNNSHVFSAYEGGYATYNLAGGVIAIPDVDVSSNGTGSVRPGRYIPVAQGFFIQGSSSGGIIEFNNRQRAYKRESVAVDDSVFTKTTAENDSSETDISSEIARVYFRFTTPEGPQRELLLAIKEGLSDGMNYGYDARLLNGQVTDCSWLLKTDVNEKLVIQGIGAIYEDLELPLHIKVGADGECKFEVASLSDIDPSLEVYFLDKELNITTRLEEAIPVAFELVSGTYTERFSIVFKVAEILTIDDIENSSNDLSVYYNIDTHTITISNPTTFSAKNVSLYNVLGQQVVTIAKNYTNINEISIPVDVSAGTYLLIFDYNNGTRITKKLILK